MVVATAVEAEADYLVPGDRHILSLGAFGSIRTITPRAFLERIIPEAGN